MDRPPTPYPRRSPLDMPDTSIHPVLQKPNSSSESSNENTGTTVLPNYVRFLARAFGGFLELELVIERPGEASQSVANRSPSRGSNSGHSKRSGGSGRALRSTTNWNATRASNARPGRPGGGSQSITGWGSLRGSNSGHAERPGGPGGASRGTAGQVSRGISNRGNSGWLRGVSRCTTAWSTRGNSSWGGVSTSGAK